MTRPEGVPGLVVGDVLRRTGKSVLREGVMGETPVVVKCLIDRDPFWQTKFGHEISAYRTFAAHPPPIRVPRLLHTDGARLLVLERLDGRPLDTNRYPARSLPDSEIDATLDAVDALRAWRPMEPPFNAIFDYARRIGRYHGHGLLTKADADALRCLLESWSGEWEVNHGDVLPSNVFLTTDGQVALLDWEFTGTFLPGFDLALLRTVLTRTEHAVRSIEQAAGRIEVPFTINLAMVLTREIRIHQPQRIALIETLWAAARERVHALAAS